MIAGVVNEKLQAEVRVMVRGANERSQEVTVVLDTGFNGFLALSRAVLDALGLLAQGDVSVQLADGTDRLLNVYRVLIEWDGSQRTVTVLEAEGDALLGMALLEDHRVIMNVRAGGTIGIEALT